mgnify:CR=1 FL=1
MTGKGHATDYAILLGLSGTDPEYIPIDDIEQIITQIKTQKKLQFNNEKEISFSVENVVFNKDFLPFHANGIMFRGFCKGKEIPTQTFYSIANNQTKICEDLASQNLVRYIGLAENFDICEFKNLLDLVINDYNWRKFANNESTKLVDGRGVKKLSSIINEKKNNVNQILLDIQN